MIPGPLERGRAEGGIRTGHPPDELEAAHSGPGDASGSPDGGAGNALSEKERTLRASLQSKTVTFGDVIRLKHWQTLGGADPEGLRSLGERYYDQALNVFKERHGGVEADVAVFGHSGTGVYVTPGGVFRYTIIERAIRFDWSEAHRLLHRIDAIAEQAREWWDPTEAGKMPQAPDPSPATDSRADDAKDDGGEKPAWRVGRSRRQARAARTETQRRPHLDRAYSLSTAVLAAVDRENARHYTSEDSKSVKATSGRSPDQDPGKDEPAPSDESARSDLSRTAEPSDPDELSGRYSANIALLRPQVKRAEQLLQIAAQRSAQIRYGRGMLIGTLGIALVCAALGSLFFAFDVEAWYGVAAPAGAVGALVSVLQRMTSGSLQLDVNASGSMISVYGGVRPLVGAIFGMALFVLLEGGLAINISTDTPLAFYAAVGFLAGFNERFAQDMLVGSAKRLSDQFQAGESAELEPTAGSSAK